MINLQEMDILDNMVDLVEVKIILDKVINSSTIRAIEAIKSSKIAVVYMKKGNSKDQNMIGDRLGREEMKRNKL